MKKTTVTAFVMAGLYLASYSTASAQTAPETRTFVTVNVLAQTSTRTLDINKDFPVYEETGNVTTSQRIGSGALFDISGGYNFTANLGGAIGLSIFGDTGDSNGTATIPNPVAFPGAPGFPPSQVPLSQTGLKHRETAVHFQVRYTYPVSPTFDVVLVAGPSIFHVSQELVSSVNVPAGTQDAIPNATKESKNAFGGNIGVEGNYYFNKMFGAGVVIRYAGAKADLPSSSGLSLGGFQVGAGVRVRFANIFR